MKTDKDGTEIFHHLVGNGIAPGGTVKGCAHSDSEYRTYIAFGTLPNPDCEKIEQYNSVQGNNEIRHP